MRHARKDRAQALVKKITFAFAAGAVMSLPYAGNAEATTLSEYRTLLNDGEYWQKKAASEAMEDTVKEANVSHYNTLNNIYQNLATTTTDTAKQEKYKKIAETYDNAAKNYETTYGENGTAVTAYKQQKQSLIDFAGKANANGIFVTQKDTKNNTVTFADGTYTGALIAGGEVMISDSTIKVPNGVNTAVWITDSPNDDSIGNTKDPSVLLNNVTINGISAANAITQDAGFLTMYGKLNVSGNILVTGKNTNLITADDIKAGYASIIFDEGSTLTNTGIYAVAESSLEGNNTDNPALLPKVAVGTINLSNIADKAFNLDSGDYDGINNGGNYLSLGKAGSEAGTINLRQGSFIIDDIRHEGTDTLTQRYRYNTPTININSGATLIRTQDFPEVTGEKNFLRINGGSLKASSDLIFEKTPYTDSANGTNTDAGAVLTNTNDTVGFDSGILWLDEGSGNFTLDYAKSARNALNATETNKIDWWSPLYEPEQERWNVDLAMSGNLVDKDGNKLTRIRLGEIANTTSTSSSNDLGLALNDIIVDVGQSDTTQHITPNLTVYGYGAYDDKLDSALTTQAQHRVYASRLNLDKAADDAKNTITLNNYATLQLGGSSSGSLVTINDATPASDSLVEITADNSYLQIGGVFSGTPVYDLAANVALDNWSQATIADGVALNLVGTLSLKDNSQINIAGTLNTTQKITVTDSALSVKQKGTLNSLAGLEATVTAQGENSDVNIDGTYTGGTITLSGADLTVESNGVIYNAPIVLKKATFTDEAGNTTGTKGSTLTISGTVAGLPDADGNLTAAKLTAEEGSVIKIGENGASGLLILDTDSDLTGSTLTLDPDDAATIVDSSQFAYDQDSDGNGVDDVSYHLTVGQNSVASLGTTSTAKVQDAFTDTGLSWGHDATSILYLDNPITITGYSYGKDDAGNTTASALGSLVVDGQLQAADDTANNVQLGQNSLLIIDAKNELFSNGTAAITSVANNSTSETGNTESRLKVDDGAKLYLVNAVANKEYTVFSGFNGANIDIVGNGGWADLAGSTEADSKLSANNNIFINRLIRGQVDFKDSDRATGSIVVNTLQTPVAESTLAGTLLENNLNTMIADGQNDSTDAASTKAVQTMSKLISWEANPNTAIAFTNRAIVAPETVGATAIGAHNAIMASNTAMEHFSRLNVDEAHTADVWAKFQRGRFTADSVSLPANDSGFKNNYHGFTVGVDFKNPGQYKHGVFFDYGTNSATANWESDSAKSWGIGYYGSIANKKNNFLFDVTYQNTAHDIKGEFSAKPKNNIWGIGLRDEFIIKDGNVEIVPHIGLNYMNINTPSYSSNYQGYKFLNYGGSNHSLLTMPIGIGLRYNSTESKGGWSTKVAADITYQAALNGYDDKLHAQVNGVNAWDSASYSIIDKNTVGTSIGISVEKKDAVSYGLGYSYHKGDNFQDSRFVASLKLKF